MNIQYCNDYAHLSAEGHDFLVAALQQKPDLLLCAATGNSPERAYQLLTNTYRQQPKLFQQLQVLKLDEWGGVPMDEPHTCESFLKTHLLEPLNVTVERYFAFESDPENPEKECHRIQKIINTKKPIDICVLGMGKNGHIAFNEPGDVLYPDCHVAQLSEQSMQHTMAMAMTRKPTYGMTIGMRDLLNARKILLFVTGSSKQSIVERFLRQEISTQLPASFLWLHPDVTCLIDRSTIKT